MDSAQLSDLAVRYGIRLLLQFGSTVTGRLHPRSDLDLAVLLEHIPSSLRVELDLASDLQALVGDRDVDLAVINRADPLFLEKILEHCRVLYGPERALHELKMYAFKRYQDHRRYLAMERAYVRRKIGESTHAT